MAITKGKEMISARPQVAAFLPVLLISLGLTACASRQVVDYPAPGKLVDVGTHRMHLHCIGEGSPVIVLEAGASGGVLNWKAIQGPLSAKSRTCSYDRSGLLWSERRDGVLSAEVVAFELNQLLAASGERGPYVLVATSLGGIFARKYVEKYPDDIVGLVLVDSSHPEQMERMPEDYRGTVPGIIRNSFGRSLTGGLLAITGYDEKRLRQSYVTMPSDVTEATVALLGHSRPTMVEELGMVPDIFREVGRDQHFGDMPVYVIAGGRQYDPSYGINPRRNAEKLVEAGKVALELQTELLSLSNNSVFLVASKSGHNINFEQPEIVIEAVAMLLESL